MTKNNPFASAVEGAEISPLLDEEKTLNQYTSQSEEILESHIEDELESIEGTAEQIGLKRELDIADAYTITKELERTAMNLRLLLRAKNKRRGGEPIEPLPPFDEFQF